jgi:hypothetical protein
MDKGEIKAATVHEIGCKFEDMLEAAKLDESRNEGAKTALLVASKKVSELSIHVDKDLDEGVFGNVDGPLAVAVLIKKYITRAAAVLESGAASAENHRLMSAGRSQAFQQMIENMRKLHDLELEKSAQRKLAEVEGERRTLGVHPGASLKEQRLTEEVPPAVKKRPKKTNK